MAAVPRARQGHSPLVVLLVLGSRLGSRPQVYRYTVSIARALGAASLQQVSKPGARAFGTRAGSADVSQANPVKAMPLAFGPHPSSCLKIPLVCTLTKAASTPLCRSTTPGQKIAANTLWSPLKRRVAGHDPKELEAPGEVLHVRDRASVELAVHHIPVVVHLKGASGHELTRH